MEKIQPEDINAYKGDTTHENSPPISGANSPSMRETQDRAVLLAHMHAR